MSSDGDYAGRDAGGSGAWKISDAPISCTHVVPLLERVLMTMSPWRKGNPSQRALSSSADTYLTAGSGRRYLSYFDGS
ncbi:MAG: hypothetical protein ACR2JQ_04990 [Mycobacteriales bacterium]